LGWIFVMSGWGKLMNISGFAATMPRRGLPEFLGYIAPFVEFIGGVLLIVGLDDGRHGAVVHHWCGPLCARRDTSTQAIKRCDQDEAGNKAASIGRPFYFRAGRRKRCPLLARS
jgi:hypothetical protein